MDNVHSFITKHSIIRKDIIIGNWIIGYSYKTIWIIAFILIWIWVTQNEGHTKVSDNFKSTVNLKVKGGFSTNYSADDFFTVYVKPNEYDNYNGQWDSSDYAFEAQNEIGIVTNLVITANQTQKFCPEHPVLYGSVCDPKNNKCVGGTLSVHGTRTGRCIDADFPLGDNFYQTWRNVSTCEIKGWCPVDRLLPPLKESKPVLLSTINTTLRIQSTIYFSDFKILKNSLSYSTLNPEYLLTCRYQPDTDPLCPTFALKDIIELTPNAGMSYAQMAISGGVIVIDMQWKCRIEGWIFKNYNSLLECQPRYSFVRTDKFNNDDQTTYRFTRYFNNGKIRTHFRTWRILFVVDTKVTVREFNFYTFLTSLLAYNTVFIIIAYAFNEFITRIYRNKKWHEEIDLNVNNDIEYNSMIDFNNSDAELNINLPNDLKTVEDQLDEDEKDENTPLIT
jgi:hypothetical protein